MNVLPHHGWFRCPARCKYRTVFWDPGQKSSSVVGLGVIINPFVGPSDRGSRANEWMQNRDRFQLRQALVAGGGLPW